MRIGLLFIIIMTLAAGASGWSEWNYTGGSHSWITPANWTPMRVPLATDDPLMRGYGESGYCLIDSDVSATGKTMWIGFSGVARLDITGGSLTLSDLRLGFSSGTAIVNVSGGAVNVSGDMSVGQQGSGIATLNMSGGTVTSGGWLYLGWELTQGRVNLDGGKITTPKLMVGTGTARLNITNGKLVITNPDSAGVANELTGYILSQKITFFDGDPRARYTISVNALGQTELTATLPNAEFAWNPVPADMSAGVGLLPVLTWSSGMGAMSHDVYFGTSGAAVEGAQRLAGDIDADADVGLGDMKIIAQNWLSSQPGGDLHKNGYIDFLDVAAFGGQFGLQGAQEFGGNTEISAFGPGNLHPNTTYYWRVDEVTSNATHKGPVWTFSTGAIILNTSASACQTYDQLTVDMGIAASFVDPYNPADVRIDMVLNVPGGQVLVVPCFYREGNSGNSRWQGRFTPRVSGLHSYYIAVRERDVLTIASDTKFLNVSDSGRDGFLKKNPASYHSFLFDSGRRFRGIGENIGWEQPGYTYDRLFPLLNSMGCNYVRLWVSNPYNQPLEWARLGLGKYDEVVAQRLDDALAHAGQNGIYLTVSFDGAGQLGPGSGEENWPKNPYNSINGGPCGSPTQFFTSAVAKEYYKRKLRYIVARWGYSTNICAFEFWNEIDGAMVHYGVPQADVVNWHNEMAVYLKNLDPFDHIVTTSCTGYEATGFWNMPEIDFSQTHPYRNQIPASFDSLKFYEIITTYENRYGKPHVLGEFGYTSGEPRNETHANMVTGLHNGLWKGMFSPTPILPLTWWWDYFEQKGDNNQFIASAGFVAEMMRENSEIATAGANASSSDIEAMALAAGWQRFAWIRNKVSNSVDNVSVTLTGTINGTYTVKLYNTSTGQWYSERQVNVSNGNLNVLVGTMAGSSDLACWAKRN